MRWPFSLARSAVGVHIDDRTVRWVQLTGSPEAFRVAFTDEESVVDGNEAGALAAVVARRRARGAVAVTHVDPLLVRHLLVRGRLPDDPAAHADWLTDELHRAGVAGDPHLLSVHAQATTTVPDDPNADGGTVLDLAAGAAVEARRRLLEEAGLVPAAVVSPWSAVARFSSSGDTVVATDAGTVSLTVWEGGVIGVHTRDPSNAAPLPTSPQPDASTPFDVATDLARCGLRPEQSPSFLGGSSAAEALAAFARARATRAVLAAALVLMLGLAGSTAFQLRAAGRLTALESELAVLAPRVVELRAAEAALAGRRAVRAATASTVATSATLYRLALETPDDVWLDAVEFRADSSSLSLEGGAADEVAVAAFLDRLDGSGVFSDARLDEARAVYQDRAATASNRRFHVSANVSPAAAPR